MAVTEKRIRPGEEGYLDRYPFPNLQQCGANPDDQVTPVCGRNVPHSGDHASYGVCESGQLPVQLSTWPQESDEHPVIEGWIACSANPDTPFRTWGSSPGSHLASCPSEHRTVLLGDIFEAPHVHNWVRWNDFGSGGNPEWRQGRVIWVCSRCPDAGPDDDGLLRPTFAPKPGDE
jgi:hypothetical protein